MNASERRLIVTNKGNATVAFVDPDAGTILFTLPMPTHPHELELSADAGLAYISLYGDGVYGNNIHPGTQIAVIDTQEMTLRQPIELGLAAPHGLARTPDGMLYVACDKGNAIVRIDLKNERVVDRIVTGVHTHWVVATPDGSRLIGSNKDADHLSVVDTRDDSVTRIAVENGTEGIALSADGRVLYAMDHVAPALHVIDLDQRAIVDTVALEGYPELAKPTDHMLRVTVSPTGSRLAINGFRYGFLTLLDMEEPHHQRRLPIGPGPMVMRFVNGDAEVWVANGDANTITVVDVQSARPIRSFVTSADPLAGPESFAFVPIANR